MQVRVLFFGLLKDVIGKENDTLSLAESATVSSVVDHYRQKSPRFKELLPSLAISVNEEYASTGTKLSDGDEVAFLPPVSGGTGGGTQNPESGAETEPPTAPKIGIVRKKIDTPAVTERVKRPEDGAVAIFEGIVRNNTHGRRTLYLDYEAYEEMAIRQMEALATRALADFKIRDLAIVHRLGRLGIGETSVLIVVAAAHRGPAFDACRWLIDTLKRTVPIWKKEHFEDGAVWADGEPFPAEVHLSAGTHSDRPASK
ncbi:MAG: molybdenum cofactor biosynthesis protein MoaE [Terriglobales bacterium]